MTRLNVPYRCFGDESPISVHSLEIADGQLDAVVDAYVAAANALTNALNNQAVEIVETPRTAATAGATATNALRGNKWRCKYQDDVDGSVGYVTIPAANSSLLTSGSRLDLTAGVGLAFKTNFEIIARSKPQPGTTVGGGNAVTLLEVKFQTITDKV